MDVKALTYYVAIVDQKSINKAAEILYISQPVYPEPFRRWKTSWASVIDPN